MIELTQEQQKELQTAKAIVPTNTPYLLIHKDLYERVEGLLGEEGWTEDAYRAAMEVFARDGWDDPRMDVYNELDPRRTS